ncbi:MAG: hypothetical protein ACP5JG_05160 [Anaerolineae bacterium]
MELLGAARIDGANEFGLFLRVVLSNSTAAVGVIATLSLRDKQDPKRPLKAFRALLRSARVLQASACTCRLRTRTARVRKPARRDEVRGFACRAVCGQPMFLA